MSSNVVCVKNLKVNNVDLLHYLKRKSKIRQILADKFFILNFVNQVEDKDDEMVVQNLRLTIFRQFQVDST